MIRACLNARPIRHDQTRSDTIRIFVLKAGFEPLWLRIIEQCFSRTRGFRMIARLRRAITTDLLVPEVLRDERTLRVRAGLERRHLRRPADHAWPRAALLF